MKKLILKLYFTIKKEKKKRKKRVRVDILFYYSDGTILNSVFF